MTNWSSLFAALAASLQTDGEEQKKNSVSADNRESHREINLFGPKDIRTPLPGNVGLVLPPSNEACVNVNNKTIYFLCIEDDEKAHEFETSLNSLDQSNSNQVDKKSNLQCVAQKCPQLVIIDFQELFPCRVFGKNITIISFSERAFSEISKLKNETRNGLIKDFLDLANDICGKLRDAGFWADYVDPTCTGYEFNRHVNQNLFEIIERYRHFGFTIEEIGFCRVVTHHTLGTKSFVGSLFTNASIDSPELREIFRMLQT